MLISTFLLFCLRSTQFSEVYVGRKSEGHIKTFCFYISKWILLFSEARFGSLSYCRNHHFHIIYYKWFCSEFTEIWPVLSSTSTCPAWHQIQAQIHPLPCSTAREVFISFFHANRCRLSPNIYLLTLFHLKCKKVSLIWTLVYLTAYIHTEGLNA